jgi:hypothetical protein
MAVVLIGLAVAGCKLTRSWYESAPYQVVRAALVKSNSNPMGHDALPPEAIDAAIDELTRDRSAMSLEAANAKKQK